MRATKRLFFTGAIVAIGFNPAFAEEILRAEDRNGVSPPQEYGTPALDRAETRQAEARQEAKGESFRASTLIGSRVKNLGDERLGNVADLVVDLESGEVAYVIVSAGGIIGGLGGELRPVPTNAFEVRAVEGVMPGIELFLDVDQDRWNRAPSIARDQVAQLDRDDRIREFYQENSQRRQRTFGAPEGERLELEADRGADRTEVEVDRTGIEIDRAEEAVVVEERREYGAREEPVAVRREGARIDRQAETARDEGRFRLASRLIGEKIRSSEREQEIGSIDDLVVNMNDGKLSFVVVQPNTTFWEMANEEYAVSPQSLQRSPGGRLQLDITTDDLEGAELLTERELQQGTAGDPLYRVRVTPGRPEIFGGRSERIEERR